MLCPKCLSDNVIIQDSKLKYGSRYRWRRRKCNDCGNQWHTIEINEDEFKRLVKNSEID